MLPALAVVLALAAAAPAREGHVRVVVHPKHPNASLELRGGWRLKRGDQTILYLARRCEATVRRARRHYVVAWTRRPVVRVETFTAQLARSVVHPRGGRACLMVADRRGRAVVQTRVRYRLP